MIVDLRIIGLEPKVRMAIKSQAEGGLRQRSAVTAVAVHGTVLLHFWSEFKLQSMSQSKGSG